jgi:hypothetical protein
MTQDFSSTVGGGARHGVAKPETKNPDKNKIRRPGFQRFDKSLSNLCTTVRKVLPLNRKQQWMQSFLKDCS